MTGQGSNIQTERIKRERHLMPAAEIGSKSVFYFNIPGVTMFDLATTVTSPSGNVEDSTVSETNLGFCVTFVPKVIGVHSKIFNSNILTLKLHKINYLFFLYFYSHFSQVQGSAHFWIAVLVHCWPNERRWCSESGGWRSRSRTR